MPDQKLLIAEEKPLKTGFFGWKRDFPADIGLMIARFPGSGCAIARVPLALCSPMITRPHHYRGGSRGEALASADRGRHLRCPRGRYARKIARFGQESLIWCPSEVVLNVALNVLTKNEPVNEVVFARLTKNEAR